MKRHFAHSSNETSSKKSRKESESSSQGWQSFQKKSNAGSNSQRQRPSKPLDTTKPSEANPKFNLEQSKKSGLSVEMHPALQALMSGGSGDINMSHSVFQSQTLRLSRLMLEQLQKH